MVQDLGCTHATPLADHDAGPRVDFPDDVIVPFGDVEMSGRAERELVGHVQ